MESRILRRNKCGSVSYKLIEKPSEGSVIKTVGYISKTDDIFDLSLWSGSKMQSIPFYLQFSISNQSITKKAYLNNKWIAAESSSCSILWKRGEIQILIIITLNYYIVVVNEIQFCKFYHQAPFQPITLFIIKGQINVKSISYKSSLHLLLSPYAYKLNNLSEESKNCQHNWLCKNCKAPCNPKININAVCLLCIINEKVTNSVNLTNIHVAARDGTLSNIREILNKDVDVNVNCATSDNYVTPIFLALMKKKPAVVNFLLKNNANVNHKIKWDFTPLHVAVYKKHLEIVKLLISSGANVNATNVDNVTPLYYTAQNGSLAIFDVLVKHGAEVDNKLIDNVTLLHLACINGHFAIVKKLITYQIDINAVANITFGTQIKDNNPTALHLAVEHSQTNIVKILIEAGVNVNALTFNKNSSLHLACSLGYLDIVSTLLDGNANTNIVNNQYWSPLYYAIQQNQIAIVKKLLSSNRLDLNYKDNQIIPALHYASYLGSFQIVKILFEKVPNVNVKNQAGSTALHYAFKYSWFHLAEFLIINGADVNAMQLTKQTPLFYAAKNGCPLHILKMLVKNRANINAPDIDGLQALHVAAMNNHSEIVNFLLKNGADIHATNKRGLNSLHFAARCGNISIVNMLIDGRLDINRKSSHESLSPLHFAVLSNQADVIERLVQKGALVNCIDHMDRTPLYLAAGNGKTIAAQELLKHGAYVSPTARSTGFTPLHAAVKCCHSEVAKLLIENNADIHSVATPAGKTPLQICLQSQDHQSLHLLILQGAQVDYDMINKIEENLKHLPNNGILMLKLKKLKHTICNAIRVKNMPKIVDHIQEIS